MLKVKVKVKGHVIRALSWILGMSYSIIDGLVLKCRFKNVKRHVDFQKNVTTYSRTMLLLTRLRIGAAFLACLDNA